MVWHHQGPAELLSQLKCLLLIGEWSLLFYFCGVRMYSTVQKSETDHRSPFDDTLPNTRGRRPFWKSYFLIIAKSSQFKTHFRNAQITPVENTFESKRTFCLVVYFWCWFQMYLYFFQVFEIFIFLVFPAWPLEINDNLRQKDINIKGFISKKKKSKINFLHFQTIICILFLENHNVPIIGELFFLEIATHVGLGGFLAPR